MNTGLEARSVSFRYPQNRQGVGPFSILIQPGERVLISGLSGSGKSTLARCLSGIIPHLYRGELQGEVWLDGMRTDQTPLWRLAEYTGFVFQNPAMQILASTVEEEILFGLENLGISREAMRDRLEEALAQFGLSEFRRRSPRTLSGGEQQKLSLAAVIARRPRLLILDEPLSMLDTSSAMNLVHFLGEEIDPQLSAVIFEHREAYVRAIPNLRTIPLENPLPAPIDEETFAPHESGPLQTLIVEGLRVKRGDHVILNGLSFQFQSGQTTALVGPNGAGKTTLLRTLAGFQPYSGGIHLAARPEKPQFGMVFQNPDLQLFNATVREEILYRIEEPDLIRYRWLLSVLDLERYEDTPPLLLSEGEKRRVAFATILMQAHGDGVLLDEPALGLDSSHQATLLRILRTLAAQGMFVLFSTHDLELAAQADYLLLMGKDGMVAQGPAREILQDDAAWAATGLVRPEWLN